MGAYGWQDVAALTVASLAAAHLVRRAWPGPSKPGAGCVSGCGTCPSNKAVEPVTIGIGPSIPTARGDGGRVTSPRP